MTRATTPIASVLMPVRNEEDSVERAIRSVLSQTVTDLELLVIDAQSQDRTVEIVTEIAAKDNRVRLLDNPQRTIPCGLNVGMRAARGRYLIRVDAHVSIAPDHVELGVAEMEATPEIAAVGGRRHGAGETPTAHTLAAAVSSPFGVGNSINHYSDEAQDTDHAAFGMYRTSVVRALGGWDESLPVNEDVDIDHRILQQGHRIRYNPAIEISWFVRPTVSGLARQYRRYGRGKAAMVRKNGRSAVRLRHLAAPSLVLLLAGAALVGLAGHRRLALAMVAPYVAVLGGATTVTLRKGYRDRPLQPLTLVTAFGTIHLSWGLGFLEGYLLKLSPAAASGRDPQTPTA